MPNGLTIDSTNPTFDVEPISGNTHNLRIGILLMPQFSFSELGLIIEPLFIANWLLELRRFRWQLLGFDKTAVVASNGVSIAVESEMPAPESFDIVFILASFETKTFTDNRGMQSWLIRAARAGVALCGIEGGTEMLAATGLLDGRAAVVHWDNLDGFRERYPEVDASATLYFMETELMSCAGGTAVLDVLFQWLQPKLSVSVFRQLQNHMLKPLIRKGCSLQLSNDIGGGEAVHPAVRRAVNLMRRSLEEPYPIPEIAAQVNLSARQLERRFRQELRVSPLRYYMLLRIARAHRLLQQTDLSIAEVAAGAGFNSLEHFARIYRQYYGCPPSRDRLQTIQAPSIPRPRKI